MTPPSRSRFDGDLKAFPAQELADELKQCKIDIQCGPGPVTRDKIAAREENIRDELARRNKLTDEALAREESIRGKGPVRLPDATVEVVLTTREVLSSIERWADACRTGSINGSKKNNTVRDLVYDIQQEVEQWIEVLEEDGR